jgi:hypothetical protein
VILFYGFLSGPDNLQRTFDGKEIKHNLQKSQHAIFGIEFDITKHTTLNIEPYFKNFSQLTNINKNKVFNDSPEYSDKPDYLKKDFIIEKGNAYGIDFSLKYEERTIYIWAAYSLGYVNRFDGFVTYNPHYDRRHNANVITTFILGDKRNTELSIRWNFGSGFPFAKNKGHYPLIIFESGLDSEVITDPQLMGNIYSPVNDGRLPFYHRLDISLKHTLYLNEKVKFLMNFGITNLYNRSNIFYFDRLTKERINQLPIMPSIGLTLQF